MTTIASSKGVRDLVAELDLAGALPTAYAPAFLAAARERFVPVRFWYQERVVDDGTTGGDDIAIDRATTPQAWNKIVYSDRPLVIQFDDGATEWPQAGYRPTSSASMPSVVAGMLRALGPQPGESVLEIGTGTGWNAALLAEIVGPNGHVTTVEIDPDVTAQARASLDAAGYGRVEVIEADAAQEWPSDDQFDRVVVTAGVRVGQLPHWWVRRTRPGGVIVAPMRADLAPGPLVRYVVGRPGVAHGRAVPWLTVGFMELRAHRVPGAALGKLRWDDETAEQSSTNLAPWVPLLADDHRWSIAIALPGCRYEVWEKTPERPGVAWLVDPLSGSWASVVPDGGGRCRVRQSGPRRLWDQAEAAYRWWQQQGQPPISAWEWAITPERQSVTLVPDQAGSRRCAAGPRSDHHDRPLM